MVNQPKVSIIIPLWVISDRFFSDLKKFDKLNYKNAELLVVSDKKVDLPKLKKFDLKLILTGKKKTGPAEKRDIAIKKAKGSICAFIDDDAYPDKNWLKKSIIHFRLPSIAAVGGPGLTPREDGYWEQITGFVYGSFFCGGNAQYRFVKGKMQFVDDYPAYNLIVRKGVLQKVGGYGNHFYGGEDTFLCLKIVKTGYKILYDPDALVFHHRRPLFLPYLKQIANIGKHRGYFAKRYPETSRKLFYFIPTIATICFFILLLVSFFKWHIFEFFVISLVVVLVVSAVSVVKYSGIYNSILVALGIILTHLIYGLFFIKGLFAKSLEDRI